MEGETLGTRLGILIEKLGMSKGDFAKKADISQSLVSNILSGNNGPSNATFNLICRTYKVNKNWLRKGEGEIFNDKPAKEPIIGPDGKALEDDEAELVRLYSELLPENKEYLLKNARTIIDTQEATKKALGKPSRAGEKGELPGIGPGDDGMIG